MAKPYQVKQIRNFILKYQLELQGGVIMHKYERIIYWSKDDEAFIVEIPELPGCMADGKTIQEAIQNAEVVIDEWIEVAKERGQEIPEPKGRLAYA